MSGRVSIKGHGADIFFGDAPDKRVDMQALETAGAEAPLVSSRRSKSASKTAGQPESQLQSQPASQLESQPARQLASMPAPPIQEVVGSLGSSTKRRLRELLEREHRTHNTHRYHQDELDAVRDIVYELDVQYGAKVSRNDVVRAALLWAIEDYRERGEHSLLVELFKERRGRHWPGKG
jgi:hypothetical protein